MKKITIILIAIFVVQVIAAQNFKGYENFKHNLKNSTFKNTNGSKELIWVQDSLKDFDYNSGINDWDATYREKYSQRFPNGNPEFVESAKYLSDQWLNKYKLQLFYDYSYTSFWRDNIDAILQNAWDGSTLSWRNDTSYYLNLTKYLNIPNIYEGVVYEDYKYKDWNFTSYQYTSGYKVDITLLSDSLYSLIKSYEYNTTSNEFDLIDKQEFTYDIFNGKNDITLILNKSWNGTTYENSEKTVFAYVDNNMVQKTVQNWNSSTSNWENDKKNEKTYDVNNYISSEISYNWDGASWVKDRKDVYDNDIYGNILSSEDYDWNTTNNVWDPHDKDVMTYNSDNYILTKTEYSWDNGLNDWGMNVKYTYEYNPNNIETSRLIQVWNGTELVNSRHFITSFDVFGNITEYLELEWDSSADEWFNNSRDVYNYDLNQNLTEKIYQHWNLSGFWDNSEKTVYYWSEFNATIVEGSQSAYFNIYPNPTSDFINVNNTKNNITSITITNVNGKVVYNNNNLNSQNNFIKMKKYGAGVYLINIKDINGNEINSKVIVN